MRLLFVTPFYYPERKFGGPPQKIHTLSRGLSACGHAVNVITFHSEEPAGQQAALFDEVPVTYLPWIGSGLRQWPRQRGVISEAITGSDIVHCYGIYNLICPAAIREALRQEKPVAIEPLGMYPPRARNRLAKRAYNSTLTRWMFRRAKAVVATSQAEAFDLEKIADRNKIHFRRNGIDLGAFANLPSGKELRARWQISPDDKLVLFIGRLSPIKNLEMLIASFAIATELRDPQSAFRNLTRLVLVGPAEAEYEKTLRRQVEQLGLSGRVVFAGPLYEDEQKAALDAADLFVLPSLNESFGNAAGEAVAANIPVLLTETCGIAPLIHRRAGLAVPLGVDSLAEGLRIMLDPVMREQFMADREQVKRELSWDEPITQTIALYEQIMRNGEGGSRMAEWERRG